MKAFVTGGTGFIGRYLVRRLVERGYEVIGLARSDGGAALLQTDGAQVVRGDLNDLPALRAGMAGCDLVFHVAAWYKIGSADWMQAEEVNVNGSRNVLKTAWEVGVPKIIYTSTVAVFGDTKGQVVDESYQPPAGPFLSEYDRTKSLAHYQVALPLIEQGAPIVIVMPGGVYGPGDESLLGDAMRRFLKGQIPIVPGAEMTVTWAHVADIAEGHILAAEKGKVGESYILAGPAIPLGEMVDFWAYLTGKPKPIAKVPARFVQPLAPLASLIESHLPPFFSGEAINSTGATYSARADKARRELGWQARPPQAGMLETFEWLAQQHATEKGESAGTEPAIGKYIFIGAAILLLLWLFTRPRSSRES